jgi:alpha-L-rhamnosidase
MVALPIFMPNPFPNFLLLGLFVLFGLQTGRAAGGLNADRLTCEYRIDPLGIDSANPRLAWGLTAVDVKARGLAQSGYEVLAASSPERLATNQGDLWDSGKIMSAATNQIPFAGKPLASHEAVWWKVKVWDQAGAESAWSPTATWTMGALKPEDWGAAKWIHPPGTGTQPDLSHPAAKYETAVLRHEFTVRPGLKRALVHICGLGQYEMTLNGSKVGQDLLTPGWTLYNKTCLYDTYDITGQLQAGRNAVGLFLGNGMYLQHKGRFATNTNMAIWYGPLQAIALIRLEYQDGSADEIVTGNDWRCTSGPITYSSIYGGEDFDARLVQAGWDKPGFDDSGWETPETGDGPGGALKGLSAAAAPVRTFDVLKPVGNTPLQPGTTVYDLGQNASLMLRMTVKGPAGSSVQVIPSELIKPGGDINDTMCGGKSYWTYTLGGQGDETYFSHFYYRGGRYLKVTLSPAPGGTDLPEIESIEGDTIRADVPATGQFSCSNDLYNKIYTLIRWAQMNNMVSILTDCPTREKRGWLEEDHLNGPALRYNFGLATLMGKEVQDMTDSQRDNGLVPSTAPDYMRHPDNNKFCNPPEWGSACILVPWQQYQFDGDVALLRNSYGTMTRYLAYLNSMAKDNLLNFGLGDWFSHEKTPVPLTGTAIYYHDARILSQIATLLGKPDDAAHDDQLAQQILASFNQKFFDAGKNAYATDSEGSNAMPLALDLVDPSARAAVLDNVVQDFTAHQTTVGEVCLRYLLEVLAEGGHSDLIYSTYNTDATGYGLQVKLGKTSLTEGWTGGESQDHFMFGQLNEWLFSGLAGIQCDPQVPAFQKIIIKLAVVGDLTEVKAHYDSAAGTIVSEWQRSGSTLQLHVVIPPNATARIEVPAAGADSVKEGGLPAAHASGLKFAQMNAGAAEFEAGSGDYHFESTLP